MKWKAIIESPVRRECEIEYDPKAGYYLYVDEQDRSFDYLQDTLEIAKRQAYEIFAIPLDAWESIAE